MAASRDLVVSDDPEECLLRAANERNLALNASLESVRQRHLRSAQTWEDLSSRIQRMREARGRRKQS